jgi:hypothetical protein
MFSFHNSQTGISHNYLSGETEISVADPAWRTEQFNATDGNFYWHFYRIRGDEVDHVYAICTDDGLANRPYTVTNHEGIPRRARNEDYTEIPAGEPSITPAQKILDLQNPVALLAALYDLALPAIPVEDRELTARHVQSVAARTTSI